MVSFSADFGSEEAADAFGPLHERIDRICSSRLRKKYSRKVKGMTIELKVSGRICNFRLDGPGRPSYSTKYRQLVIELGIPRKAWEQKPPVEIKQHLANGVREAFSTLQQRLAKMDDEADLVALGTDFEACLSQFLK